MQNVEYIGTTTINKLYAVNSSCHQLPFRTEVGRSGLQLVPAENQTDPSPISLKSSLISAGETEEATQQIKDNNTSKEKPEDGDTIEDNRSLLQFICRDI
ncbi:hypothetical protein YC2023_049429 [Brassica napus]